MGLTLPAWTLRLRTQNWGHLLARVCNEASRCKVTPAPLTPGHTHDPTQSLKTKRQNNGKQCCGRDTLKNMSRPAHHNWSWHTGKGRAPCAQYWLPWARGHMAKVFRWGQRGSQHTWDTQQLTSPFVTSSHCRFFKLITQRPW